MIRVKLPFGGVSPEQLDAFADVIERWVPLRKGHITTRQNIQLHHVPLADAAKLIRELGEAGLSSREGCGNTVRNVTADPYAGVATDEVFDPTPYAGAYVRYFVRHPVTQAMPRKWKTAFSASPADRAIVPIHDIGFLPVIRDGERGFEVWVGGGTAIMPRLAHKIYDFVGADDGSYLKVTEAIVRIFDRQDWLRKNRARARIKVLLEKIGPDAFRALVDEELEGEWTGERDYAAELERLRFDDDEEARAPAGRRPTTARPTATAPSSTCSSSATSAPQRQAGFNAVAVKVVRGDLTPEQFRGLAAIMREFCGGNARTTVEQNLVLRWVRDEALYDVWRRLDDLGLAGSGALEIDDVISCPGTDSCKMGITASMGLNEAISERLEAMDDRRPADPGGPDQDERLPQRLRPAPHRHDRLLRRLAEGRRPPDARLHPPHRRPRRRRRRRLRQATQIAAAGQARAGRGRALAADVRGRARARARASRPSPSGSATSASKPRSSDLTLPAEFSLETMEEFIDWNRSSPYKVERGEGECAI